MVKFFYNRVYLSCSGLLWGSTSLLQRVVAEMSPRVGSRTRSPGSRRLRKIDGFRRRAPGRERLDGRAPKGGPAARRALTRPPRGGSRGEPGLSTGRAPARGGPSDFLVPHSTQTASGVPVCEKGPTSSPDPWSRPPRRPKLARADRMGPAPSRASLSSRTPVTHPGLVPASAQ